MWYTYPHYKVSPIYEAHVAKGEDYILKGKCVWHTHTRQVWRGTCNPGRRLHPRHVCVTHAHTSEMSSYFYIPLCPIVYLFVLPSSKQAASSLCYTAQPQRYMRGKALGWYLGSYLYPQVPPRILYWYWWLYNYCELFIRNPLSTLESPATSLSTHAHACCMQPRIPKLLSTL